MRGHLDLDVDGRGATERYRLDALKPGETDGNITRTEDGYVAHVGITRIHNWTRARWCTSAVATSPAPPSHSS